MCSTLGDQEWLGQCSRMPVQHLVSEGHLYTTGTLVAGTHLQHRSGLLMQIKALLCWQVNEGSQALFLCVLCQLCIKRYWKWELGKRFVIDIHTFLLTKVPCVSSPSTVAVDIPEQISTDPTMLTRLCFTVILNCSERMMYIMKLFDSSNPKRDSSNPWTYHKVTRAAQ